eukprot:gene15736-17321_t
MSNFAKFYRISMNQSGIRQQTTTNEVDKSLASFQDAFSPLVGRKTSDRPPVEPCGETKLYEPLAQQWSPIKAVHPSQIFPAQNIESNANAASNSLVEFPTMAVAVQQERAVQMKYQNGLSSFCINKNHPREQQKSDSDYFSSDSSPPGWEASNPSAFGTGMAWDSMNLLRVENIYTTPNHLVTVNTATNLQQTMPSQFHSTMHLNGYQDAIVPISSVDNASMGYAGKTNASSQWYVTLPPNGARSINTRQHRLPNIAAKKFVPVNPGFECNEKSSSWKYIQPLLRTECAMPTVVMSTDAPMTMHHSSAGIMAKGNGSLTAVDKTKPQHFSLVTRKLSLTKERVRERAIRDKLNVLIAMLPYEVCKSARPGRSTILQKATEYINALKEDIVLLERKLNVKIELQHFPRFAQLKFTNMLHGTGPSTVSKRRSAKVKICKQTKEAGKTLNQLARAEESSQRLKHRAVATLHVASEHKAAVNREVECSIYDDETTVSRSTLIKIEEDLLEDEDILKGLQAAPSEILGRPAVMKVAIDRCHLRDKATHIENTLANLKRPMNSFMLYSKENRQRVVKENPGLDNRSISRKLGSEWSMLSTAEKMPYRQRFRMHLDTLKSAFPNWSYNSYKGRETYVKRQYKKRSTSCSVDIDLSDKQASIERREDVAVQNPEISSTENKDLQDKNVAQTAQKNHDGIVPSKSAMQW